MASPTNRLVPCVLAALVALSACSGTGDAEPVPRAGGTSSAASGASPTSAAAPAAPLELRPDLITLPATGVVIEGSGDARVLRFGTTLANVGVGPLEVVPDATTPCPPEQRSFNQVVRLDADGNGAYDPRIDTDTVSHQGVCALFHSTHEHWHIDGSARYSLLDLSGAEIEGTRKVSFCLRDSQRLVGPAGANSPDQETYLPCARNRLQGISPGWGDLYDRTLDGQTLALPSGMPGGRYCLRMTADPFDQFRETDETNNASLTPLRIGGKVVRVGGGWCA